MTYNQAPQQENHNTLYFIVGGLLVLAMIIGAFVFNSNRAENNAYEPAAGSAYESTTAPATDTPATGGTMGNADTTTTTPAPDTATGTEPMAP